MIAKCSTQSCYKWSQNLQQSIDGGSVLLQLFFEILFGNSSVIINSKSKTKTGLASSSALEVSKSIDGVVTNLNKE